METRKQPTLRLGRVYVMNGKHWGPGLVTFDTSDASQEEVYDSLKKKEQAHTDRERHAASYITMETAGGPMSYHRVPTPAAAPAAPSAAGLLAPEPGSVAALTSKVAEQERLAREAEHNELNRTQGESGGAGDGNDDGGSNPPAEPSGAPQVIK